MHTDEQIKAKQNSAIRCVEIAMEYLRSGNLYSTREELSKAIGEIDYLLAETPCESITETLNDISRQIQELSEKTATYPCYQEEAARNSNGMMEEVA